LQKALQKAKAEGNGPRRSVLILHVTGEEHGLHGSRFYSENPLYPLANTVADVNIDMIGRRDEFHKDNNYVYVIGSDYLSSDLYNICEEVNKKNVNLVLDYKYNDKRSKSFLLLPIITILQKMHSVSILFNGTHADYHQPTDDVEKLNLMLCVKEPNMLLE
jgi:hypothetical protein